MTIEPAPSAFPGVRYGALPRHVDERGTFTEVWRASSLALDTGSFVQANVSTSAPGVLRGLHIHRRQLDYWVVVSGRAFVALVDIRPQVGGSPELAAVEVRELLPNDWVVIPAGVAHGFLAIEALQLLYLVTNEYDGSDELGFAWDDPAVGVPWPVVTGTPGGRPIVSDRDASNPSLAELLASLRESSSSPDRTFLERTTPDVTQMD
jgi:dTDP-4-dehydrorhamnose 3,5-epimerase